MLFKRVSRAQAETVFIVAKNVSGSTLTAGYTCVFDVGASVDGVRVTQASAADLNAYAGVADSSLADGAYGLVQVYGYRSSAYVKTSAGANDSGSPLKPVAGAWASEVFAPTATAKAFGFLCEALSASSSSQYLTTAKVFIRAL